MGFKRKLAQSIGTSPVVIGGYTVPAATEVTAIGLIISNVAEVTIKATAVHYDGVNNTHFCKAFDIIPGGAEVVIGGDQKVVMEPGDQIKVWSDTAASIDVILSILEG